MSEPRQLPIACDLDALDPDERARRAALAARLKSLVTSVAELPDGYAFRVEFDPAHARDALDWFLLERRCCPFLRLEVTFEPGTGPLWLRMSGGPGVKDFLGDLARRVVASPR